MKRLLAVLVVLAVPAALSAQVPRACTMSSTLSLARLRTCLDTVNARRVSDSARFARSGGSAGGGTDVELRARVDSLARALAAREAQDFQIRNTLADIYAKLPHRPFDGASVDSAIATAKLGGGTVPIDGLQAQMSGLAARLAVVESAGPGSGSGGGSASYPGVFSIGQGDLQYRSNLARAPTQSGITDSYAGRCGINGWDGGFRCLQNWQHEGTKLLPGGTFGMDSRAAFSYNWWPAAEALNGNQESPDMGPFTNAPGSALYNAYRGQTFIVDGGSQAAYDYSTGAQLYSSRNVLIAAQRAGWSIYFAVSPERGPNGDYPLNRAVMKLEASPAWNPNPVSVVIDGTLQRLKSCNVGGVRVVCF